MTADSSPSSGQPHPTPGLAVTSMTAGYGGAPVVRNLSFDAAPGEVVSLIGPNGAGKTTSLNVMASLLPARSGQVQLAGRSIVGTTPYRAARQGVAYIPSDRGVFANLTVAEHLRLTSRSPARRSRVADAMSEEAAVTLFPSLQRRRNARAAELSGGEQQMLAITKAVMLAPRLLLVDELSLGLAPKVLQEILPVIRTFADETAAIVVLVEQHYELGLEVSDRCIVLSHGDMVFEGSAEEIRGDRTRVEEMYLR